jgi:hypothetical protein
MIAEDLGIFFADFGVAATWGGNTATVLLDAATEDMLGGRVIAAEYTITMESAEFPGIARDAQVVIGADTYRVREVRLLDDGAVKELMVAKL